MSEIRSYRSSLFEAKRLICFNLVHGAGISRFIDPLLHLVDRYASRSSSPGIPATPQLGGLK